MPMNPSEQLTLNSTVSMQSGVLPVYYGAMNTDTQTCEHTHTPVNARGAGQAVIRVPMVPL